MAARDLMPYNPDEWYIRYGRLNASETFAIGEPVAVNADGEVTESADNPVHGDILGIAAVSGDTGDTGGSFRQPSLGDFVPSQTATTGDRIAIWVPKSTQSRIVTPNVTVAGTAFGDTAPAVADLGLEVGLTIISGSWGIDYAGTNEIARIEEILDADKIPITLSSQTGVYVVFSLVTHQNVVDVNTTPDEAAARVA